MHEKQISLQRGLKSRHIHLMSLGGTIGTGLFLGSAQVIQSSGPGIILGYAIVGCIASFITRQICEMAVAEPVAGTLSYFAYKYYGNFAGFVSGWNYWVLYILVAMTELTAIGQYIQFWYPSIPTWMSAALFLIFINIVNLMHVRVFGEIEFWLCMIKIISVLGMILFGFFMLLSNYAGSHATISNLWQYGGFLPHGYNGLFIMMPIIMFSFGGLELIGMTAAEAAQPNINIPRATNQLIYCILFFYICSLTILLALRPWSQVTSSISPFVVIFHQLDDQAVATIFNMIVLAAALSVYNSCVYCNSRMLFSLAQQGNAPSFLWRLNRHGVPTRSILFSAVATTLCLLLNYYLPNKTFILFMALTVSALVLNWTMITLVHIKFRRTINHIYIKEQYFFRTLFYPFRNWLCLLFMVWIVIQLSIQPNMVLSVWLIPVWICVLSIGYWIKILHTTRYEKIT
ncbi:Aromatic amino acid transport protein AroP [Candidatus Erwinia haradaeae]|uniref:Aromatic amino acid transport protein AroP n=1 Tax=Candidatus Erwinia haradaeae TaxID=1922217 RepID=A0A451DCV1_9GAMM|nr:amino acid permease [Candidatus Erwinia haradaeae]VFP84235.1 Aromatic amino acid transport protein AroP [Candidatus Erwinia haradaeae]